MIAFAIKHWRWFALGAAILALMALLGWFSHSRYTSGEAAGRDQVQKAWDAATEAQRKAYDSAVAETAKRIEADRQAAMEVERGLREQLAAADAGGRSLSQRLRQYQASLARCGAVPATPADASNPAGTVGSVSGDAEFVRLSDAAWAACARDGVRLNRIDAWRVKVSP